MGRNNQNSKWSPYQSLTNEVENSTQVKTKEVKQTKVQEEKETPVEVKFEAPVVEPEIDLKETLKPISKKGNKASE